MKVRYCILNEQKPEDSESDLDQCLSIIEILAYRQIVKAALQDNRSPATKDPDLKNLLYFSFSDFMYFCMCIPLN